MNLTEEKKEMYASQLQAIIQKNIKEMGIRSKKSSNAKSYKSKSELSKEIAELSDKNIVACVGIRNLYLGLPPPKEIKL